MNKIGTVAQAKEVAENLHAQNKNIVLVGGCFDILHVGHLALLEKAKAHGDALFILLEHDDHIKKLKGPDRPINLQTDRAKILAALSIVDYIVLLDPIETAKQYDAVVEAIKPTIIATTAGDSAISYKERSAQRVGAKVVAVTDALENQSTTQLIQLLKEV